MLVIVRPHARLLGLDLYALCLVLLCSIIISIAMISIVCRPLTSYKMLHWFDS